MSTSEAADRLYVFAPVDEGSVLTGRLEWRPDDAAFQYASSWLTRADAYALDPKNLPLGPGRFRGPAAGALPGVFMDAGPDAWGRHLLELTRGAVPASPLDLLRVTSGTGTGALRFSLHRDRHATPRSLLPQFDLDEDLEQIEADAWMLSSGNRVASDALARLTAAGSSLGGARPKALIRWRDREWIAKFSRAGDAHDVPAAELASLRLASRASIHVPDAALIRINGRSVLLVARFDRAPDPVHYLSFHALLAQPRLNPATDVVAPTGRLTYGSLAAHCRQIGVADAGPALFRRMVFNIALGNTDDHLRNHGLLYQGAWRLAPAFDLVPIGGELQAVGVGTAGRERSLPNALSDIARFGLSRTEADAVVDEVSSAFGWLDAELDAAGVSAADADLIRGRVLDLGAPPSAAARRLPSPT